MSPPNIITIVLPLMLFLCLTRLCSTENSNNNYVNQACSVTRYRNLCIHSLAPFSNTAKQNPTTWARAGVSVSISEAKNVAQLLIMLKTQRTRSMGSGRNRVALLDCVEVIQDAIDNLHKSLGVLRKLSGQMFDSQMGDVITWLSAAITDEGTCLDGFVGVNGQEVKLLRDNVSRMSYITSNALALVNKLATTGPYSINHP